MQLSLLRNPSVPLTSLGATADKKSVTVATGADHTAQITPTFVPRNVTDKTVTYKSADDSKLTVSNKGVVTAVAEGTGVVVTVKHTASGKTTTISFDIV